jgi:hypothetical protein
LAPTPRLAKQGKCSRNRIQPQYFRTTLSGFRQGEYGVGDVQACGAIGRATIQMRLSAKFSKFGERESVPLK